MASQQWGSSRHATQNSATMAIWKGRAALITRHNQGRLFPGSGSSSGSPAPATPRTMRRPSSDWSWCFFLRLWTRENEDCLLIPERKHNIVKPLALRPVIIIINRYILRKLHLSWWNRLPWVWHGWWFSQMSKFSTRDDIHREQTELGVCCGVRERQDDTL